MSAKQRSRPEPSLEQMRRAQLIELYANKAQRFCIKQTRFDMSRKSLSTEEEKRLVNCYSKLLHSTGMAVQAWSYVAQEFSDISHRRTSS